MPNQRMSYGTKGFGLETQNQQKEELHRVAQQMPASTKQNRHR
jgi:hypothetical protein